MHFRIRSFLQLQCSTRNLKAAHIRSAPNILARIRRELASNGRAPTGRFVVTFQSDWAVQSFLQKYSSSRSPQIISRTFPVSTHRGAARDRHGRGRGMRWTRQRFARDGIARRVFNRPMSGRACDLNFSSSGGNAGAPILGFSLAAPQWPRPDRDDGHNAGGAPVRTYERAPLRAQIRLAA